MTIKELENRTGMTRTNIRFYEGEGLLCPRRLENGYRDFSEEDVRTLEKIKLLRQLQMDLDTIRLVQRGGLTLEQALFSQLTKLEGDKTVMERAAQVCRELERSGVEYGALEPGPWLLQLQQPQPARLQPAPPRPPARQEPHDDAPRACYYPWRRLFARSLDTMLYSTAFELAWMLISWDQTILDPSPFVNWALTTLMLAFTLAVEPLWLHFWGWTPGKWVFGLKVRDRDGNRLTLAQGWRRSMGVGWNGYGWNLPIVDLVVMWGCRKRGLDGQDCSWDADEGYRYTKEERRLNAAVVYLLAAGVCTVLLVLAALQTNMPRNRGPLTVAEFAQNYNQYHHRFHYGDYKPELDREGRWVKQAAHNTAETYVNGEKIIGDTTVWDEPEFTLTDGRVTSASFHVESRDTYVYPYGGPSPSLILLAMSGSVDGLNLFNYDLEGWLTQFNGIQPSWEADGWNGCAAWQAKCRGGLHIGWQAEYTGYELDETWGRLVCVDKDAPHHYEQTVTISLIE